jgi:hypothetical protein
VRFPATGKQFLETLPTLLPAAMDIIITSVPCPQTWFRLNIFANNSDLKKLIQALEIPAQTFV